MKIIKVVNCAYCPYLSYVNMREHCEAMLGKSGIDNRLSQHVALGTIPDWCPLEDDKEKEGQK